MTAPGARWVLASGNPGKLREFRALLADTGLSIVPQSEFGLDGAAETGASFVENALIKARHAASSTGLPAIADDSGLSVDALDGAPGVRSARFAGSDADADANIARLLEELRDTARVHRTARFHCVIVALTHADEPAPLIAHGKWLGRIALQPAGSGGFGYDPVFFDPALGVCAAELSPAAKNAVSHRFQAARLLKEMLLSRGLITRR